MDKKIVLVTGASSGFGKLTVERLLERGHTVIAALRGGRERAQGTFSESVRAQAGARLRAVDLHLDQPDSVERLAGWLETEGAGRLDVLVNNAGFGLFGSLEDMTPGQLRDQFEVNFFGPMFLTRALLPALRRSKGRVINLSSIAGLVSFPHYGAYCASKHALDAMSEGLYYELRPFGVQVALLEPGGFKTEFAQGSKRTAVGSAQPSSPYHARQQAFDATLAKFSGRLGDPDVVVRRLVRLCEAPRIPLRTLVGVDARLGAFLKRVLPDCVRVRIQDWVANRVFYRGT